MDTIQKLLLSGPVVTDGAWGTELQALGLAPGQSPDAWNLLFPERVERVARSYVDAGSQVILTNTFGANQVRLAEQGLADKLEDINHAGVEISRRAAGNQALVFASIGPTGKMIANGDITGDLVYELFETQSDLLREAGADALVIETMGDLEEAAIAVAAARTTGLPIIACMVFDFGKNKDRTMMGNDPEEAVEALSSAGANVIGANCGQGISGFAAICKRLRAVTTLPIWLKPNAGLPRIVGGRAEYTAGAKDFASQIPELIEAGANFVGGCCGTNPEFIKAVKAALSAQGPKLPEVA